MGLSNSGCKGGKAKVAITLILGLGFRVGFRVEGSYLQLVI